jgi:hypothetical protein
MLKAKVDGLNVQLSVKGCSCQAKFQEALVVPSIGSKVRILLLDAMVMWPPYCGTPRLSHQFPVEEAVMEVVAVVVEVAAVDVVTTGVEVVVVVLVVVAAVVVEVDVVEDEQDANTSDITSRKARNKNMGRLFM